MPDHLKPFLDHLANQKNACELAKASFQVVKFLDNVFEDLKKQGNTAGATLFHQNLLAPLVIALSPYASFLVETFPIEFAKFINEQPRKGDVR